MRILGLDSSGIVASVAVVEDDVLVAEYTINYKKTHSQTLLPMLDEIVKMTELDLESIDAIAVAAGPGSQDSSTRRSSGIRWHPPTSSVSPPEPVPVRLSRSCSSPPPRRPQRSSHFSVLFSPSAFPSGSPLSPRSGTILPSFSRGSRSMLSRRPFSCS